MLQVAMLSRWHVHAEQYAREIEANPNASLTSVWDEDPQRGGAWADALGVPFEADLGDLLERPDVDAVCVTAPTNRHAEVMVRAAEAGKHIFTEKVLAATVADCDAVLAAVDKAGVRFAISFPHRTAPRIRYARQAIDDGLFGRIVSVRIRNAHDGAVRDWLPAHFYDPEATGGGAMMDLGAHGMYLCRWLLGAPKRIVSVFTTATGRTVEDVAVCAMEFENGAIAVNETGFASFGGSFALEIDGTEGGYRTLSPDGVEVRSRHLAESGWQAPARLPDALPKPIDQWIAGCTEGSPIEFGLREGRQLTELMEAAYIAHREGREVRFGA